MVSSTSMFTSCKDYDDDINNIVATKADKTELQSVKTALESEIQGLKDQLTTVNGQITNLTNKKADKFTENGTEYNLETVWNTLKPLIEKEANLRGRLEVAESAIEGINTLIGGKISDSEYFKDCENYYQALEKVWAKVAALDTQLGETMQKVEGLDEAINKPGTGLKAVVEDLTEQVNILNGYKARVEAIEADYLKEADKQELITKINNEVETLNGKIATLRTDMETAVAGAKAYALEQATEKANDAKDAAIAAAKKYTDDELAKMGLRVDSLAAVTKAESERLDEAFQLINDLNVYVRQALRGLVFNMDTYYAGIEATDLTVLWYKKYTLAAAGADQIEQYGYAGKDWTRRTEPMTKENFRDSLALHKHVDLDFTTRYIATAENNTKVLKFQAKYYMNPSSAAISSEAGTVDVVATDKPYHSAIDTLRNFIVFDGEFNGQQTNYREGNIKVVNWETKNGQLIVDYDCTHPEEIRSILGEKAVTIFATQVKEGDNLITSDFAALYKQDVKDLRIAHTPEIANDYANHNGALIHNGQRFGSHKASQVNGHCGYCDYQRTANDNEYHAGLHLMQTVAEAAGASGVKNNGTTNAEVTKFKDSSAGGFDCQDSVGYKDTLDLMKLVEIHYTTYDANGENENHKIMPADMIKAAGLKFRFTLTGLYYGTNLTSESAHAAIKHEVDEDGNDIWMLRPQMPDSIIGTDGKKEGVAVEWDKSGNAPLSGKQARQTIGRTPLVRVELYMPDEKGEDVVVDYGYIRIKIVEHPVYEDPYVEPLYLVNYDTPGMTASQHFCKDLTASPFEFTQRWIEMEYDIMADIDITQNQFETNYTYDGSSNKFKQFYLKAGVPTACTNDGSATDALGTIYILPNPEDEQTNVVKWIVTEEELAEYAAKIGYDETKANYVRVVRFEKRGNSSLPAPKYPTYIYVSLTPKSFKISAEPKVSGVLNWENKYNQRNIDNWYAKNANPAAGQTPQRGLVEIHAQTLSPEDTDLSVIPREWTGFADSLTSHLADVFTTGSEGLGAPNKLIAPSKEGYNAFVTVNGTSEIKGEDLKLDLVFVDSTYKSQIFKANNKKSYKLCVVPNTNGKALGAYESTYSSWENATAAHRDTIAIMYFDQNQPLAQDQWRDSINHWQVGYRNRPIADALLNYAAHNELADDVVKAVVGVKASYLTCNVPLTNNTFDVRFLRPINVSNNDKPLQDAGDTGAQRIYLRDIVQFTDWRDVEWKTNYWEYYQIKFIEIANVEEGGRLSDNSDVLTDLNLPEADKDNIAKAVALDKTNGLLQMFYTSKPQTPVNHFGTETGYGYLTYNNFSNTTQTFHIWLPVKVTYIWGDIYTTVKVTINSTQGNARQAK